MTDNELGQLCAEWQKRLRLQDWNVQARFVRRVAFGNTTQRGRCAWSECSKAVRISVLDPIDYDLSETLLPDDPELILVHELLHIHFIPFVAADDTPEDTAQEQAINCIAGALVEGWRSRTEAQG